MGLFDSGRKLTDEDFYGLMDTIGNKTSSFIDELSAEVGNQNPFSAFIQNVPPEARAQIMQPLEQKAEQMPEVPYTNNDTFQSLAGGSQTGGHDIYSGSDPTDYGVAGGEQVSNMDKYVAQNLLGGMNFVVQPEVVGSGLFDIGSGYSQQATGDITNQAQVDQANAMTQGVKDMFTYEGLHKGPDAVALAAGGTYLAGKAGKFAGEKLPPANEWGEAIENVTDKALELSTGGIMANVGRKDIIAHHGSPHDFDKFDHDKMGSGEGAQAWGWGTYLAENPDIAGGYQKRLSGNDKIDKLTSNGEPVPFNQSDASQNAFITLLKNEGDVQKSLTELETRSKNSPVKGIKKQNDEALTFLRDYSSKNNIEFDKKGSLYDVNVPDKVVDDMIDWDVPVDQQPNVLAKLKGIQLDESNVMGKTKYMIKEFNAGRYSQVRARDILESLGKGDYESKLAAKELEKLGIPGVKFLDSDSRNSNYMLSTPEETVKGDWMVKDNMKPNSLGKHFDNEADAKAFLEESQKKTNNFVVFNEDSMNIVKKDGKEIDDGVLGQVGKETKPNKNIKFDNSEDFIKASVFSEARDSTTRNTLRKSFDGIKEVESADILEPNPKNPKLDDSHVDSIEMAIESGDRPYILVDGEKVIDGHHRLQAYKNLGFDEVPVVQKSKAIESFYNPSNVDDGVLGQKPVASSVTKLRDKLRKGGYKVDMSEGISGEIQLSRIEIPPNVRGKGLGSKAMEDITKMADKEGKVITLTPDTSFGGTSVARLKKFYKKFGFVENKGKNKDFLYRDSMLRIPLNTDKVKGGLLAQEPLVVYRSSTSGSYDKFDKSKQRTSTLGKGVYMFDGKKGANDWVGSNLQKIELPHDYMEKSINWGDGGQSDFVTKAFKKIDKDTDFKLDLEDGGIDVYPDLVKKLGEDKAQALLSKHGIYGNRRKGELTTFNVDDAKIISTKAKKAKKGLLD